ncbi:MAG: hypothetical protein JOY78_00985 [Pseudonocardia sp.]|nr:hypothetical protein [Pseudonocardia sp.]
MRPPVMTPVGAVVRGSAAAAACTPASAADGLVVGSLRRPRVWSGAPFGADVSGSSHAVLPAGLYRPIGEYDRRTLANDLSTHLVYGLATEAAFRVLFPRRGRST